MTVFYIPDLTASLSPPSISQHSRQAVRSCLKCPVRNTGEPASLPAHTQCFPLTSNWLYPSASVFASFSTEETPSSAEYSGSAKARRGSISAGSQEVLWQQRLYCQYCREPLPDHSSQRTEQTESFQKEQSRLCWAHRRAQRLRYHKF